MDYELYNDSDEGGLRRVVNVNTTAHSRLLHLCTMSRTFWKCNSNSNAFPKTLWRSKEYVALDTLNLHKTEEEAGARIPQASLSTSVRTQHVRSCGTKWFHLTETETFQLVLSFWKYPDTHTHRATKPLIVHVQARSWRGRGKATTPAMWSKHREK